MSKIQYPVIIEDHDVVYPATAEALKTYHRRMFGLMMQKDGRYIVSAKRDYGKKTNEQMGYYRGVVVPFITEWLQDLGNDINDNEVHIRLKHDWGKKETHFIMGEYYETIVSLADYDKKDFIKFFDDIGLWVNEFLMTELPPPEKIKSRRKKK